MMEMREGSLPIYSINDRPERISHIRRKAKTPEPPGTPPGTCIMSTRNKVGAQSNVGTPRMNTFRLWRQSLVAQPNES